MRKVPMDLASGRSASRHAPGGVIVNYEFTADHILAGLRKEAHAD